MTIVAVRQQRIGHSPTLSVVNCFLVEQLGAQLLVFRKENNSGRQRSKSLLNVATSITP